jgi:hypothetical protein
MAMKPEPWGHSKLECPAMAGLGRAALVWACAPAERQSRQQCGDVGWLLQAAYVFMQRKTFLEGLPG